MSDRVEEGLCIDYDLKDTIKVNVSLKFRFRHNCLDHMTIDEHDQCPLVHKLK